MKKAGLPFILIGLIVLFSCGTKSKTAVSSQKATVSGSVVQTFSYCGGAEPTDEMLAELATPQIYPGKKFHVIKGDTNTVKHEIVLNFTSDSAGKFSFQLAPGRYSILLDEQSSAPDAKKYISQHITMDEACYKKWWATPYCRLEVKNENIKDLKFSFHHRCFVPGDIPCLGYDGPLPP